MKNLAIVLLVLLLTGCSREYVDADFWTMHTIESQFNGADGVDLFDIDGDGDTDVASVSMRSVEWYENVDGLGRRWSGCRQLG